MIIERVVDPSANLLDDLSSLLTDAVESGAGVSFMRDLSFDRAREWWSKIFAESSSKAVILAARDERGVVGTVQLQPSWAPNQPHRADVAKLIVHRRARGKGVARALMRELERYAREEGFTLLLLDTCKDSVAERLYSSTGWTRVGVVPNFALNPDGSLCDTVFFYKQL